MRDDFNQATPTPPSPSKRKALPGQTISSDITWPQRFYREKNLKTRYGAAKGKIKSKFPKTKTRVIDERNLQQWSPSKKRKKKKTIDFQLKSHKKTIFPFRFFF